MYYLIGRDLDADAAPEDKTCEKYTKKAAQSCFFVWYVYQKSFMNLNSGFTKS